MDENEKPDDNCAMTVRTHIALIGCFVVALLSISSTIAPPDPPRDCRCVDEPMEALDLPITEPISMVKQEKVYSSLWRPSERQGIHRIRTTFFNIHSKEALPVLDGRLPPAQELDTFFRCRGFGTIRHLDDKLVTTAVAAAVHFNDPRIEVISGYRSPKFNDALAKKGRHVASESNHTRGAAMDFRLSTVDAASVSKWLSENFDGGVGTYVLNNFVHIDTGLKRRWRGR